MSLLCHLWLRFLSAWCAALDHGAWADCAGWRTYRPALSSMGSWLRFVRDIRAADGAALRMALAPLVRSHRSRRRAAVAVLSDGNACSEEPHDSFSPGASSSASESALDARLLSRRYPCGIPHAVVPGCRQWIAGGRAVALGAQRAGTG